MTVWKKAMSYLGLGPDDAYDDYDLPPEPERAQRSPTRSTGGYPPDQDHGVRPVPRQSRPDDYGGGRGPGPSEDSGVSVRPRGQGSAVRPVGAGAPKAPHTVRPLRFDQAQEVADTFKHGQPVIMNVQEVDRDLLRRLIDFASGLCYALNGKLDKVATGVYLLTPSTVSDEDRRQMAERDFE
jgi:cell division inhibitor SepF